MRWSDIVVSAYLSDKARDFASINNYMSTEPEHQYWYKEWEEVYYLLDTMMANGQIRINDNADFELTGAGRAEYEFWNKYEKFDYKLTEQLYDEPNSFFSQTSDAELFNAHCCDLCSEDDPYSLFPPSDVDPDIAEALEKSNTEYLNLIFWVPKKDEEDHLPKNTKQTSIPEFPQNTGCTQN